MFKRNIHEQTKVPVLARPQQSYLAPSLSFSLGDADSVEQSERSWLNSLPYMKHNALFQSNGALLNELVLTLVVLAAAHDGQSVCVRDFSAERKRMCIDVCHAGRLRVKFFFQP